MILAIFLLLAASPGRVALLDETVQVPAAEWRSFDIELRQQPAIIECRYWVDSGGAGVRVALMHQAELERLRAGLPHHVLTVTEYRKSGGFRYGPGPLGDYSLVVDNRLDGRDAAQVHLAASLEFPGPPPEARELSPQRRLVVILVTAAFMAAIAVFAVRRLKGALLGGPNPPVG
jgi:hypothetical protein